MTNIWLLFRLFSYHELGHYCTNPQINFHLKPKWDVPFQTDLTTDGIKQHLSSRLWIFDIWTRRGFQKVRMHSLFLLPEKVTHQLKGISITLLLRFLQQNTQYFISK